MEKYIGRDKRIFSITGSGQDESLTDGHKWKGSKTDNKLGPKG
jgi:hypothetical protein